MKNAMKKLMSLVLVAMLLVSTIPFAASAATPDAITVVIIDNATNNEYRFEKVPTNTSATVINLLNWGINNGKVPNATSASFMNAFAYYANGTKGDIAEDGTLVKGDSVRIRADITFAPPATQPTAPATQPTTAATQPTQAVVEPIQIVVKNGSSSNVIWSGEKVPANGDYALVKNLLSYCFNSDWENVYSYDHGWSSVQQANVGLNSKIYAGDTLSIMLNEKNSSNNGSSNNGSSNNNNNNEEKLEDYTKFHEDVYLYIYNGTTVGSPVKKVNITDGIAADGKVTMNEVKSVVKQYFNSIDTDTGITYDGIYPVQGNWVADYVIDKKYDTIDGLFEAAAKQTVILRVMIGNAKLASSSSSNADSTNPKTGDEIYMAVTAMAVSASALALGFYFFKKRAI